jgi:hypothetical protein
MYQILNQICKAFTQWARNVKKCVVWRCVQKYLKLLLQVVCKSKTTPNWCVGMHQILNQICKASPQWARNAKKYVVWRCAKYFKFVNASALQVQKTHQIDVLACIRSWTESLKPRNGLKMPRNYVVPRFAKHLKFLMQVG